MAYAQAFQAHLLPPEVIDRGLQELANGCPNLRKVALVGATELGLLSLAEECLTLQDLELHKCNNNVLRGITACENLQVLKLVSNVKEFYSSTVSVCWSIIQIRIKINKSINTYYV
ncbi:F-box protein At5g07670-like [Cannabis sativa]|uniref:F-box protein At5g07670-like n=1 Tax=Cannabis sativa TaxID=3483 RepID=UPI0029CA4BDF|nr:F-box protein At5g07670-like [Cannabis sativa]